MAGDDSKVSDHVKARRRHRSAKAHQQVLRRQHQPSTAILPRFLEFEQQRTVRALGESLLRDWRPRDVPGKALQLLSVMAVHPLPAIQIDPPHLRHREVWKSSVFGGPGAISRHQSQRRLPYPIAADLDAQGCCVIASSQRGMLELHLGRLGVCLIRIETAELSTCEMSKVLSPSSCERNARTSG